MIETITYFSAALLFASFFGIIFLYKKITFEHFYFLAIKSFLNKSENNSYFCSKAIAETIRFLLKNNKNRMPLLYFIFTKDSKAIELMKHNEDIQNSLIAFKNLDKAFEFFKEKVKKEPKNYFAMAELMELFFLKNDTINAIACYNNIDYKKANKYTKAKYLYFGAILDMKDGDMLSVSEKLAVASKIFNKEKALVEEARCYSLISMTYKACGMFDTSQFILEPAMEIYEKFSYLKGIANTYAMLGSLMSTQERFDEANKYFEKAKNVLDENEYGYILAQEALNKLLQKEHKQGIEIISKAIKNCKNNNDETTLSLCYEIAANLNFEEKKYQKSIEFAKNAAVRYKSQNNLSAFLESKYIEALSLFSTNKIEAAEQIAREIITIAEKQPTSFHYANCYNLLGLIFLQKKEFSRAKALFKESVGLEHKNNRTKEIASDYFNIGLAEIYSGHRKQALESLENALKYAREANEKEIIEIVSNKIEELKTTTKKS